MMKTFLIAAATVGIFGSAMFAPAFANGPRASGGNTWPGMSERVDTPTTMPPNDGRRWTWQSAHYERGEMVGGRWVVIQ